MPLPHRLLAATVGLTLLVTACSSAITGTPQRVGAPGPSGPRPDAISFRDCTAQLQAAGLTFPTALKGKLQIGCGRVPVPLDYSRPTGRQISITVLRVHDRDNTGPTESLLANPGGPGVSGLDFALGYISHVPVAVLQRFDLIGFDPRGVGTSAPINCISDSEKDKQLAQAPDVTTAAGFLAAKRDAATFANACKQAYGSALPFFNTVNTARDMDQIRQAVGDNYMNYLGFSYGTQLGWVYAHLFPQQVRAVVLDGAVDPDTSGIAQAGEQLAGFEQAFDQFAANCRTVSPCRQLSDPRRTVLQITAAAARHPLTTSSKAANGSTPRPLTYALAFTGVLQALYSKSLWPQLASALISAAKGDGTGLLKLADSYNERTPNGTYSNVLDANSTISCNDSARGPTDETIRRTAQQWVKKYPLFGRWSASSLFSCQSWQPDRTPVPKPRAATRTKVLVVGNLHDPATPYQGAEHLADDLGNAELLTWDGEGHTSYGQGSTCIDGYVNKYLLTQALPPADTTCPAR